MISSKAVNSALAIWASEITQERATLLITESYFTLPDSPPLALRKIAFDDGTVDYSALRRNRINIFQRWRKCQTSEQCEKFDALVPAILAAIGKQNAELHQQVTAGNSVSFLISQLLKENTEAVNAALNGAALTDFEQECDEAELAITELRMAYRQQYQRHDQ